MSFAQSKARYLRPDGRIDGFGAVRHWWQKEDQMNDPKTIEPNLYGEGVAVYAHGVYPDHSVLAGQDRRSFVARFDTVDEAVAAYPEAEVLTHTTKVSRSGSLAELSGLGLNPPGWFDPYAAGERWDDDY